MRGARPTVAFPIAGRHCPLISTKLYCLMTGHKGVIDLPRIQPRLGRESNPQSLDRRSDTQRGVAKTRARIQRSTAILRGYARVKMQQDF